MTVALLIGGKLAQGLQSENNLYSKASGVVFMHVGQMLWGVSA